MVNNKKLFKKLLSQIKGKESALSYKEEKVLFFVTIFGTIISTFFAIKSFYLTIQIGRQSTKIEKMDSLVRLLVQQNTNQLKSIEKLKEIQEFSSISSQKLSNQIELTTDQNKYLKNNSAPEVNIIKIEYAHSVLLKDTKDFTYYFTNSGGRTLKNLRSIFLMFLPFPNSDSIFFSGSIVPPVFPGNTTDLKPNVTNMHFVSIPEDNDFEIGFSKGFIAIIAMYLDPLTNTEVYKPFFYQNKKALDGRIVTLYATAKETKMMIEFIKKSPAFQPYITKGILKF